MKAVYLLLRIMFTNKNYEFGRHSGQKKSKSVLFISFFCLPGNAEEDFTVRQKKDLRKNYET